MNKKFIHWSEHYSVKVKEIDEQHMQLVEMLNSLYSAFMDKHHHEIIVSIVNQMIEYAALHFETEEKYFREFNYPKTEEHIAEHTEFVSKVTEFSNQLIENQTTLTFHVLTFLQKWLTGHSLGSDREYSDLFVQNGLK